MDPMLPKADLSALSLLSAEIFQRSGELRAVLPSPCVRASIGRLVREMNSYYSNLIEGHKTLPKDIERALRQDFSENETERRNQELSVAHIHAETSMRDRLAKDPNIDVYAPEFIRWIHQTFYEQLPRTEWTTASKDGKTYTLEPGRLRNYQVSVGHHTPPAHDALAGFMKRFQSFYHSETISATDRLIALAAAHHRLVWIHPFGDGNGRVARLQSQAAMITSGVDGEGLWTLSRGLARKRPEYYAHLQAADEPRRNDLDGRGNLSDRALSEFCHFFLTQESRSRKAS